jgi:hypothetical protein
VVFGVRWHDGGILLGLVGLAFAVVFAVALSPLSGAWTATLSLLAIASRIMFVRMKPRADARRARLMQERERPRSGK